MSLFIDRTSPTYTPPSHHEDVDPGVRAQVDAVLGASATAAQREHAYKLIQAEVDNMVGIGNENIYYQWDKPTLANSTVAIILRRNGIPVVADLRVIEAVDSQLADATTDQLHRAYDLAQHWVTQRWFENNGGVGSDASLSLRLGQMLRDAGLPTRISQLAVDKADELLRPEATLEQQQQAYELVQETIDDWRRWGIRPEDINLEALLREAGKLLVTHHIPTQIAGDAAAQLLERDFGVFDTAAEGGSGDGKISLKDLRAVAADQQGRFTPEQQEAASTVLNDPVFRARLQVAGGNGEVDPYINPEDLKAVLHP